MIRELHPYIRDVADYPKPGIVFKDITPLLGDPGALSLAVELMANPYRGEHVSAVIGAESRGFIFGTAVAQALNAGFVPVRKPGKLPGPVHGVDYDLEYGKDRLEVHTNAVKPGSRVVLVDDLLATGGTMVACCELMQALGVEVVGLTVLVELAFLEGRKKLERYGEVHAVMHY